MTFEQFIQNPEGKGASNTPNKSMYEQYYTSELDKLILKVNGKIDYTLSVKGDVYYILFKIPHHKYENFFYDVVVEFSTEDDSLRVLPDIKKYDVKFFTNDPSFTFTWAYAFNKHNMLIRDFKSKVSPLALKQAPTVRNPSESTGYDKYIYYAFLLIKLYNLYDKSNFTLKAKPYSVLNNSVMSANAKFEERTKKEEEYKKLSKGAKDNIERNNERNTLNNTDKSKLIGKTPISKTIGRVGNISNTKVTNTIAKTRRSKRI